MSGEDRGGDEGLYSAIRRRRLSAFYLHLRLFMRFFGVATLLSVAFLSVASTAWSQSCEGLFSAGVSAALQAPALSTTVSAGYRLNSHILKRALEEPSTRESVQALIEIIDVVERGSPNFLIELIRQPQHPRMISGYIAMAQNKVVSERASAILTELLADLTRDHDVQVGKRILTVDEQRRQVREYLRSRAAAHRLPPLPEVLDRHPSLFKIMARMMYEGMLTLRPMAPSMSAMQYDLEFSKAYDRAAADFAKAPTLVLSIQKKIQLAVDLAPAETRATLANIYMNNLDAKTVLAQDIPGAVFVKKKTYREAFWQRAAFTLFDVLADSVLVFKSGPEAFARITDIPTGEDIRRYLLTLLPEDSPDFAFLHEALSHRFMLTEKFAYSATAIRQELRQKLVPMGDKIRAQIKELDLVRRREYENARSSTLAQVPVETMKSKNGGQIRPVNVQGNLIKDEQSVSPSMLSADTQVSVDPSVPAFSALSDLVASKLYAFKFPESVERNFVVIDEAVVAEMKRRNQSLSTWAAAFLNGPVGGERVTGVKQLHGTRTDLWEIRLRGVSLRVVVLQDKTTKTWRWLTLVPHERVVPYFKDHRL